jgi:hypothetical protein
MQRHPAVVVSATVTLALLSGCGGSSKSARTQSQPTGTTKPAATTGSSFSSSYQAATLQLETASKAIGAAIKEAPHHNNRELAQQFHALATEWQSALSALEALTPPAGLAVQFNTLKDSVSRAESDLNGIVSAASTNDDAAAEQSSATLVNDVAAARSADAPIRRQLGLPE